MDNSAEKSLKPEDTVFALDIGTRSVVGIVGQQEGDLFRILDVEIIHHPDRNMYDGQIHDIAGVVQVVKQVKSNLEERLGFSLKEVAIAAAGRALKTYRVQVDRLIDEDKEIDRPLVNNLEMEALQLAQAMLDKDKQNTKYYCVGYTVVNYYLNDAAISSLLGHKGNKIAADLIATFLPHVVVDSLYTVMNRIGLEVMHLSLEPIAAINVSIPPKARLLNLALVDIGAGTSDIVITKDGTIVAYAMAAVAGDEITEELAQKYLLDFDEAEALKLNLNKQETQNFTDIVGIEYKLKTDEILETISTSIENLASQIAQNILDYNQKSPSAIFLVGGGSQIPCLPKLVAEKLSIPPERVVVRGTEIIQNLSFSKDIKLSGPEFITPIGIGVTAIKNTNENFLHVTVDGQKVKMFNAKQLTVSDALVLIGYNAKKLLAQKGTALNVQINGKTQTISGEYGEMGKVVINGQPANLETKLNNNDAIVIEPATAGNPAEAMVKDLLPVKKTVSFDDKPISLVREIRLNGQETEENIQLKEGDHLTFLETVTLRELAAQQGLDYLEFDFFANSLPVPLDYQLQDGDLITRDIKIKKTNKKENPLSPSPLGKTMSSKGQIITLTYNGKHLTFEHNKKELLFIDIFNHINLDLSKIKGQVDLELNGKRASFTDSLKSGDNVVISFKD